MSAGAGFDSRLPRTATFCKERFQALPRTAREPLLMDNKFILMCYLFGLGYGKSERLK